MNRECFNLNGKEEIIKAIEFNGPAYLPCLIDVDFMFLHEKDTQKELRIRELLTLTNRDCCNIMGCSLDSVEVVNNIVYKDDEWGVKWLDDGHGMFTTYHPLEDGYEFAYRVNFPNPENQERFKTADLILESRTNKYMVGTVWFTLFERLWMLRGFENMMMDPYAETEAFLDLKERIMQVNLGMIDQWLLRDVDGVFFSDDWGSQKSLLISPSDWRKYYKEDYARMFSRVKQAGKHVWMHLCGNVESIIPDLIEIGLNVLNPVQPQAMSISELGKQYGGKVCFDGGVDIQGTMLNGNANDVKHELRSLVNTFGAYNGGYIANTSHTIMPETPLDNIIALLEAVLEYGNRISVP